jgi:hypothetical protein
MNGPIPDDYHENDAGPARANLPPLSQEVLDHVAALKKLLQDEPGDQDDDD